MKARRQDGSTFEIKAVYSFRELARMAGVDKNTIARWVRREEVSLIVSGKRSKVPLTALRDTMPELWEAIRLRYSFQARVACPKCGANVSEEDSG